MNLQVDIQSASSEPAPDEEDIRRWIRAALESQTEREAAEISVRLVDIPEMSALNAQYRSRTGPTNVLSFPCELPPELKLPLLGDIVVCVPVVRREAVEQNKSEEAHWAHMMLHGTLHLLGFDHIEEQEAQAMEALESAIMHSIGYPCPYRENPHPETLPQ
tara:strand:+ start:74151 stop:74633 length:483 start_codon:yes stop_codon:yes gene_type:complete